MEICLYFFDHFLAFPEREVIKAAKKILINLLKKKRSRKIMRNYFLNLTVSDWKEKRLFTGKLLFNIFPDYIKGTLCVRVSIPYYHFECSLGRLQ